MITHITSGNLYVLNYRCRNGYLDMEYKFSVNQNDIFMVLESKKLYPGLETPVKILYKNIVGDVYLNTYNLSEFVL